MEFTFYSAPIGKPRMTRRDKWKQRPCVMGYRAWCDGLREAAGVRGKAKLTTPTILIVHAYFGFPSSWDEKKRLQHFNQPHTQKPDSDNILKAVSDALFQNDEMVFSQAIEKTWQDERGARIKVRVVNL